MVHAAFVKLWETRDVDFSDVAAKGYLQRIVVNNCLDHLRHEKIKAGYEAFVKKISSGVVHEDSFDVSHLQKEIEKSIAALPEQMRNVFLLSRYSGLKYKQIAKHLGISVKTVETQMVRALHKLRQQLPGLPLFILLFFSTEL
jgi:RNA polymerase sigma-70 factor (ECF subfamily)